MISVNLTPPAPETPSPNAVTLGIRASTYGRGGHSCLEQGALQSWDTFRRQSVAHSVAGALVCLPPAPADTTWNVWILLSGRCRWMSGSVQNVRRLELLLPLVRHHLPPRPGALRGASCLLGELVGLSVSTAVWRSGGSVDSGQPRPREMPPARLRAWWVHVSPGFSFFPDAGPVSEEEVSLLLADVVPTTSRLRPHSGRTRAIARTRQSERVRATVNRNRISTARRIQVGARAVVSASPAAEPLPLEPLWVLPTLWQHRPRAALGGAVVALCSLAAHPGKAAS